MSDGIGIDYLISNNLYNVVMLSLNEIKISAG